jgi:hypothetical protein
MGNKGQPVCKADNLTIIFEPTVYKMWEPQHITTLWSFYSLLQATWIEKNPFHIRRNNKVNSFVIIKGHVICAYSGFNTVSTQQQSEGIPPLITEMEGITHTCTWFYTLH